MDNNANMIFRLSDVYNEDVIDISNGHEEKILGQIILNRIVGIAYRNLNIDHINKETRKALDIIKRENEIKFDCFLENLQYVSSLLEDASFKFAFLKGAFLAPTIYERGCRTSNDIDILINKEDISCLKRILTSSGFIQGHCDREGNIIPADRKAIINSNINYGETVPFLKYYNGRILEIDVNFSLDYKSKGNDAIVQELLNASHIVQTNAVVISTLSETDFLIHLCCHLFKEATTYDWVINRRDLMLYKFSDINVYVHTYGNKIFFRSLYERIKYFGLEEECYYAFENSSIIYPRLLLIPGYRCLLQSIRPNNVDYMKQIVYPKERTLYEYTVSFEEWFNEPNRMNLLKKIN